MLKGSWVSGVVVAMMMGCLLAMPMGMLAVCAQEDEAGQSDAAQIDQESQAEAADMDPETALRKEIQKDNPKEDLEAILIKSPKGVSRQKTYPDGSFKSVVSKGDATVDDIFDDEESVDDAISDARTQAIGELSKYLEQTFAYEEEGSKVKLTSKQVSVTDATKSTEGSGFRADKRVTSWSASTSAILNGVITLLEKVEGRKATVVVGLSNDSINASASARSALKQGQKATGAPGERAKTAPEGSRREGARESKDEGKKTKSPLKQHQKEVRISDDAADF